VAEGRYRTGGKWWWRDDDELWRHATLVCWKPADVPKQPSNAIYAGHSPDATTPAPLTASAATPPSTPTAAPAGGKRVQDEGADGHAVPVGRWGQLSYWL
jgi:hypothetical protein